MPNISKHYTKKERKSDNGEKGRICLFIVRNSISIHNFLKGLEERIRPEMSGWWNFIVETVFQLDFREGMAFKVKHLQDFTGFLG